MNGHTDILAIETSCDETAAAVVRDGHEVLSNIIFSQIDMHTIYGGVVPELASRAHIEKINPVIEEALRTAGMTLQDVDAVAVTYGPGLVGALLVGVAEAKAVAFAAGKPLIGVNHIEGHISANYIEHPELKPPYLGLVVSGGHTHLVIAEDWNKFRILGRTVDDAAGEAFDKVARAVGLGYPGGPKMDKAAKGGDPNAIHFTKAKVNGSEYDFSFSGLKSACLNYINTEHQHSGFRSQLRELGGRRARGAHDPGGEGARDEGYRACGRRCGQQRASAAARGGMRGERVSFLCALADLLHGQRGHDRSGGLP